MEIIENMEIIEVCNIWKSECNVKVRTGENLCPYCKGQGASFSSAHFKQRYFVVTWCILCRGEGKVDWLKAVNKRIEPLRTPGGYPTVGYKTKGIKVRCIGPQRCKKTLKRMWKDRKLKSFGKDYAFF